METYPLSEWLARRVANLGQTVLIGGIDVVVYGSGIGFVVRGAYTDAKKRFVSRFGIDKPTFFQLQGVPPGWATWLHFTDVDIARFTLGPQSAADIQAALQQLRSMNGLGGATTTTAGIPPDPRVGR